MRKMVHGGERVDRISFMPPHARWIDAPFKVGATPENGVLQLRRGCWDGQAVPVSDLLE